jgi:hypothetical protein
MISLIKHLLHVFVRNIRDIVPFGEGLTKQAIRIFIGASLPRMMRLGKIENEAGTECITPSNGGGGGGNGSSIGKAIGAAAGLAALASLFNHKPIIDGGGGGDFPTPPKNPTNVVRNDVVSAKDIKVMFYTEDPSTKAETETGAPVIVAGQAPYYAKIHLGTLTDTKYGNLENATFSIANTGTGAVKFTPDQSFLFLKEGLPAREKPYDGVISLTYRDAQGLAHVGQYHVPIYTTEMLSTLSADKRKTITDGNVDITYMTANDVSQLYMAIQGATIVSARWQDGYCELRVSGGTLIGDGVNDTITIDKDKALTVADDNIAQGDCNDKLNGQTADFTRLIEDYSINSTGELRSQGETQIGNTYYAAAEHSFEARKERIKEMTDSGDVIWPTVTQAGGDAYTHGTQIGWHWKDEAHTQGEWVDYMGNPLNPEQVTIAEKGIDPSGGVKLTDLSIKEVNGTWQAVKSDGKVIDINNETTKVMLNDKPIKDAATYALPDTVSVLDTWLDTVKKNNPLNKDTKYDRNNIGDYASTGVNVTDAAPNQIGDNTYTALIKELADKGAREVVNVAAGGAGTAASAKTEQQEQASTVAGETKSTSKGTSVSSSTSTESSAAPTTESTKQKTVTASGEAPANVSGAQARAMAERAATLNALAQLPPNTGYTIVNTSYENGKATVRIIASAN